MQLPDETISYHYQSLLVPTIEDWAPAAEFRARHYLSPGELKDLVPRVMQVRSQIAAERELKQFPPEMQPLEAGFIDLPQLSVGTSAGLLFNYTKKTTPGAGSDKDVAGGAEGAPFSPWDVGLTGPRSLWGLVNDVFVRFYF